MVSLPKEFTLFLLKITAKTTTLINKCILLWWLLSGTKLRDLISQKLTLALKSFILTLQHVFIVRIRLSMFDSLVQTSDGVLLSVDLATVVLNHCVALVLKLLILSLGLDELSLQLLQLFTALASKRLR